LAKKITLTIDMMIEALGIPEPQKEYRFHDKRRWRFDYAWPKKKIAVEYEGATWSRGRHTRGKGYSNDCEKYSWAAVMGWTVIRITSDMLKNGIAYDLMQQVKKIKS
jgi:uncharacterized protein (UPF0128 family)